MRLAGGHILLVDDDADYTPLVQLAFSKAGIPNTVEVVGDGASAIHHLQQTLTHGEAVRPSPSLVVLDLKLPGLGGFEVLRWIRKQPHFDSLPVVVLTGTRIERDAEAATRMGADGFLVKPFQFRELVHEIQEMWGPLAPDHEESPATASCA